MKKLTMKKMLAVLSLAFAVSATAGLNVALAAAEENDATTIDAAFSSVDLVDGASVRYNDDGNGMGLSFALKMDETAYAEVMSAESGYSNVKFGVLISLNDYYKVHPFNTQANIDTYYSLNEQVSGKAFAYDMQKTELVENPYEAGTVYFRASIVDIKDANMTLDYRAVGYVEYTKDIDGVATTEKYFFTDDVDSVRCPVEVSDIAIATMKADGVTEDEQTKIDTLNTNYSSKVDWTIQLDDDDLENWSMYPVYNHPLWYNSWGNYSFGATTNCPNPDLLWDTTNRYINSKYTTRYTLTNVATGDSMDYTRGMNIRDIEGIWRFEGWTTCAATPELGEVKSYNRTVAFQHFYQYPTVNDMDIAEAAPASISWDSTKQMYKDHDTWAAEAGYYKKATGAFVVDAILSGTSEFRIYTTTPGTWDATFNINLNTSVAGENGFFVRVYNYWAESKITGDANAYVHNNKLNLRMAFYNNTMFFFVKSMDASGNAIDSEFKLVATLDATNGWTGVNGMSYTPVNGNNDNCKTHFKNFLAAATSNEFAFGCKVNAGTNFNINTFIDDDAEVAALLKPIINANVETLKWAVANGEAISNAGRVDYFTKGADNVWTQSTADNTRYAFVSTATGDWMATLKINSASAQSNARFFYGVDKFVEVMSPSNNELFFTANAKYASEIRIGANTSVFHNEDIGSVGDGWLDVMVVRSGNTFSIYICEYLDAEGNAATYDSWTLMYSLTADGVETFGEGFSKTAQSYNTSLDAVRTGIKGLLGTSDIAVALHTRSGKGTWKVNMVDDDATVAAFMSGSKLVADYAKA